MKINLDFSMEGRRCLMKDIYITSIHIENVRHLQNIDIPLSSEGRKHLILTGINGAGKSSVLNSLRDLLFYFSKTASTYHNGVKKDQHTIYREESPEYMYKNLLNKPFEISFEINSGHPEKRLTIGDQYKDHRFVIVHFSANRMLDARIVKSVESLDAIKTHDVGKRNSQNLVSYLVLVNYQKMCANEDGDIEEHNRLTSWFDRFKNALRDIYGCNELELRHDRNRLDYYINMPGRNSFSLREMADGYSAFIDIMAEIMLRMEYCENIDYDLSGIVLIDEIETHLHVDLQKKIMPFLIRMFPNIQFIVTTHSPFVISSIENSVIYDLEKQLRLEDMSAYSYEGIINDYFESDMYSEIIKQKYKNYKELYYTTNRSAEQEERFTQLIQQLESIEPSNAEELIYAFREMELQRRPIEHGKTEEIAST